MRYGEPHPGADMGLFDIVGPLEKRAARMAGRIGFWCFFKEPKTVSEYDVFKVSAVQRIYDGSLAYRIVGSADETGRGIPALSKRLAFLSTMDGRSKEVRDKKAELTRMRRERWAEIVEDEGWEGVAPDPFESKVEVKTMTFKPGDLVLVTIPMEGMTLTKPGIVDSEMEIRFNSVGAPHEGCYVMVETGERDCQRRWVWNWHLAPYTE